MQRRRIASISVISAMTVAAIVIGFTLINIPGRGSAHAPPRHAPILRIAPKLVRTFHGPDVSYGEDVAYSPDGKTLVTANADGSIYFWDLANGRKIATLKEPYYNGHDYYSVSVAYSPNGKTLAVEGRDSVTSVWDISRKMITASLDVNNCPAGASISYYGPNGATLATACGSTNSSVTLSYDYYVITGSRACGSSGMNLVSTSTAAMLM